MKKLHNDRGETLVEVLATIVVATLSVTLLFGCIMTSSKIDMDAKDLDKQHYEDLNNAEEQGTPAAFDSTETFSVTIARIDSDPDADPTPVASADLLIAVYGGEGMYSYKEEVTGP